MNSDALKPRNLEVNISSDTSYIFLLFGTHLRSPDGRGFWVLGSPAVDRVVVINKRTHSINFTDRTPIH